MEPEQPEVLTIDKLNTIKKMHITYHEKPESSFITIDWDETDSDLHWWNEFTEDARQSFMTEFLINALTNTVETINHDT